MSSRMGETAVSPMSPLPSKMTRLRAEWLRRAKPAYAEEGFGPSLDSLDVPIAGSYPKPA
jgi:hypothetical protein